MAKKNKQDLTTGPILSQMARLSGPMVIGLAAVIVFNLVDTFFIGQLGGDPLAAIGFCFPVMSFLFGTAIGLSTAASSVMSRMIGAVNDPDDLDHRSQSDQSVIRRAATDILMLCFIVVIVLAVIGYLTIDPLFTLLGAGPDILPLIRDYMEIWYAGMVFLVVPMAGNSILRAEGDTLTPAMIMVTSAIINCILDPILIFGLYGFPRLEMQGAALASMTGRAVTFIIGLLILRYRDNIIEFTLGPVTSLIKTWKDTLFIAGPATANSVIIPLTTAFITRITADFGDAPVAALGAGMRLEGFAMIAIYAVSSAYSPFVGQNWGADRLDRATRATCYVNRFSFVYGLIVAGLFFAFRNQIAGIFSNDPEVIKYLSLYVAILPISYTMKAVSNMAGSMFNAVNRPLDSTLLVAVRMACFYVPFAFIGRELFGVIGIFAGVSIGGTLGGIFSWIWEQRFFKQKQTSCKVRSDTTNNRNIGNTNTQTD